MTNMIRTQNKKYLINVLDIKELSIFPEQCTGDGEYDTIEHWNLQARLYDGRSITLFEASEFDQPERFFYSHEAVKGINYTKVELVMNDVLRVREEALIDANIMNL